MLIGSAAKKTEADLTKAVCVDFSSIAVLVEICRAVHEEGGQFKLSGVDANNPRMFSLSHLDKFFVYVTLSVAK